MKFFLSTLATLLLASSTSAEFEFKRADAKDIVNEVNRVRAANGVSALCMNHSLRMSSWLYAVTLSTMSVVSGTGSDGSTATSRAARQHFNTTLTGVEEVVGAGYTSAANAVQEWMSSPATSKYILGDYKFVGAGWSFRNESTYKTFWVLDLAKDAVGQQCE